MLGIHTLTILEKYAYTNLGVKNYINFKFNTLTFKIHSVVYRP